ncbi:Multimeric flavodoxin WrbA [Salinicoccus halodurans]|uniref:FMN-dependent NADPH-azoreductase n=2 Tax=Salinicoccus halodurans TaxID=407035 RepID=A0A0F7HKE6_9STAP|nr:BRAMP protein [Salinicoccus halodurans]SFK58684.1 Multimeric flavodoxin WrbA [Salinicoccus halodurans]
MALKALYLNTSLKHGDQESNTEALMKKSIEILENEGVETELLRVSDYNIKIGMSADMGEGDQWPMIFDKIVNSDIIVMGTPIWNGHKSSVATLVMERIYAQSGETAENGQSKYYNKVFGTVVTGNEDGAKEAGGSILSRMANLGFTIPPNNLAYWVGEAGPGPSYIKAGQDSDFTKKQTEMLSYNLIHLARILKNNPIPAIGNTLK